MGHALESFEQKLLHDGRADLWDEIVDFWLREYSRNKHRRRLRLTGLMLAGGRPPASKPVSVVRRPPMGISA